MLHTDGCIDHKVLLTDGSVVDEPAHNPSSSLLDADSDCHDCAASPGHTHHMSCDSARKPDGSQILIDAVTYWVPGRHTDPREPESDVMFIVRMMPSEDSEFPKEPQNMKVFAGYDNAVEYIENDDIDNLSIQALPLGDELPNDNTDNLSVQALNRGDEPR